MIGLRIENDDGLITFREVLKIIGRPKMAASTVHRWRSPGVRVGGQTVRLQAVRVGQRWYTRRAWLDDFLAACNAGEPAGPPAAGEAVRLDAEQAQRAEIAGAHLDTMLHSNRGRPRKVVA